MAKKLVVHPVKRSRLEVIPLIDVVFFCLATFVLVTLTMNKNKAIPVNLPVASSSVNPEKNDEAVTLTITEQGDQIFWDKDGLTWDQFVARLDQYKREETDPKIMINGDERAFFGKAVVVLDEVRKAGIQKVTIVTRSKPAPRT